MSDAASALPTPGWYDDPEGGHQLRWWSGSGWTAAVLPKADPAPDDAGALPVSGHGITSSAAAPATPSATVAEPAQTATPSAAVPMERISPRRAARAAMRESGLAPVVELRPGASAASAASAAEPRETDAPGSAPNPEPLGSAADHQVAVSAGSPAAPARSVATSPTSAPAPLATPLAVAPSAPAAPAATASISAPAARPSALASAPPPAVDPEPAAAHLLAFAAIAEAEEGAPVPEVAPVRSMRVIPDPTPAVAHVPLLGPVPDLDALPPMDATAGFAHPAIPRPVSVDEPLAAPPAPAGPVADIPAPVSAGEPADSASPESAADAEPTGTVLAATEDATPGSLAASAPAGERVEAAAWAAPALESEAPHALSAPTSAPASAEPSIASAEFFFAPSPAPASAPDAGEAEPFSTSALSRSAPLVPAPELDGRIALDPPPTAATPATAPGAAASWWLGVAPGRASTGAAWVLALAPWLLVAAAGGALWVWASMPELRLALAAAGALIPLAAAVLVVVDIRQLERGGWSRPASGWWMLLGTVPYLLARGARLSSLGARSRAVTTVGVLSAVLALAAGAAACWLLQQEIQTLLLLGAIRS
ncbi:DUF2510 domain-containing protein [Homoserinibacter sp. YIM 151385]|uniref:DUF2510 domain-containing protein n=1 Tax=Homoserinibacter sp. YIM 151385 TaxID=2985506 RepID=UPI0022F0EE35|nr:DUF2510 domain-containing protein [Homoserinibacter sp. YIM 151385]WBU38378.1 DUF2510 domain-containing protein [Homoserinibacter sp. YIM 151385]